MTAATPDGLDLYHLLKGIGTREIYTEVDDHDSLVKGEATTVSAWVSKMLRGIHRKGQLRANWVLKHKKLS
jgi:hypothetical protein